MTGAEWWVMRRVARLSRGDSRRADPRLAYWSTKPDEYVLVGDDVLTPAAGPFDSQTEANAAAAGLAGSNPGATFNIVLNMD